MSTLRIAFLGPFGTFTEQALRQVAPENAELIPLTSPPLAMKAVREGRADWQSYPLRTPSKVASMQRSMRWQTTRSW